MDQHFQWVITARHNNQQVLLRLSTLCKSRRRELEDSHAHRRTFAFLVGAAFSLWRAAFLCDTERRWSNIIGDADRLLDNLIRDNAINYPQDRSTREWMGGYYVNNALWRLKHLRSTPPFGPPSDHDHDELRKCDALVDSAFHTIVPNEKWDLLHSALVVLIQRLEQDLITP